MHSNNGPNARAADLRAALRVADQLTAGPGARDTGEAADVGYEDGNSGRAIPPVRHRVAALAAVGTGAGPTPGAWGSAWQDVLAEERARLSRAGLGWVLTRLAAGVFPTLDVLEVGSERLRLTRLAYAPAATGPEVIRLAESAWTELAPASGVLPPERAARLFLLAGGVGHATAGLGEALHKSLAAFVRGAHRDDATGPLLLAVRATGWQPLERAAEAVREESGALLCLRLPADWPAAPDDLVAPLPLRTTVWLAAAHVDGGSGTVGLVRRPLFAAGTRADDHTAGPIAHVPVTAPPPGAAGEGSVATVVTGGPEEPPSRWQALRVDRLELPPGSRTTLRYELRGRHRVELRHDGPHESEPTPWAVLASGTPRRLSRPRPVDLMVAVEIAGPQVDGGTVVEERLQEAAAVVDAVAEAVGAEDTLRVGLLGYRDHDPLHRAGEHEPVVHRLGMAAAPDAVRGLAAWRPSPLRHDFATGLEHVPHELAAWRRLWRPDSHRVLLVVGSRPPHPRTRPPQVLRRGVAVRICPDRLDWRSALATARHYDGLACVAVVDEPVWMEDLAGEPHLAHWAAHAWDAFGTEGRFTAGHDPRLIAAAVVAPALCLPQDGAPIRLVVADGTAGEWLHAVAG
ncbi:hypothetical protein [Streptomyces anandii]|uniref:hypothetical protein n=1 Tax=Streptomyces anandii TaxID=285454 RepID=UPI0016777B77|nr:hypothetical protein [Streptomyces anandii]GGX70582.1 hypothetical protein GCM10010510_13650 [Streptomyces anandii JCM 4720]